MRTIDVSPGTRYGRLVVLEETLASICPSGQTKRRFQCKCDCGTILEVRLASLRRGHTESCGCLQKERAAVSSLRHGLSTSSEHGIWAAMLSRCHNPKSHAFHLYGRRGIVICERWRKSFEAFYADMGPRPSPNHSIDRIDGNKGYCLENCRWTTWTIQQRNRRNNRLLTLDGRTLCMSAWADKTGISSCTIHYRLKRGYTVEQALTMPLHARKLS